jgi:hypothetical protein
MNDDSVALFRVVDAIASHKNLDLDLASSLH